MDYSKMDDYSKKTQKELIEYVRNANINLAQLFDDAPKCVHAFEADMPYHHNIGIRQSIK
mgnify:CR=1 FL=1